MNIGNDTKVKDKDKERLDNHKIKPLYFTVFIIVLILLTIAYASLAINMGVGINGVKRIETINWHIEFQNIEIDEKSISALIPATIDETKTGVNYSVNLKKPGDYYAFNVDIINSGSIDAKIYEIVDEGLTIRDKQYLKYEIKYEDGTVPLKDDVLKHGETKKLYISIEFKEDIEEKDLPSNSKELNLKYNIVYVER